MIEVTLWPFIHELFRIVFHLYNFIKVINYHIQVDLHMSICISDMHMSVCMPISDKLDSHSSPIVDLKQDFTRVIALKDLSIVADSTGIVSQILMMLYMAEYKSRFVACRVSSSLWLIIYKSLYQLPDFPMLKRIHKIYLPQ